MGIYLYIFVSLLIDHVIGLVIGAVGLAIEGPVHVTENRVLTLETGDDLDLAGGQHLGTETGGNQGQGQLVVYLQNSKALYWRVLKKK